VKKILRTRLPEHFADKVPPLVVELAVGIVMAVVMTLARLGLVPWTGDRAPYALVFAAVVCAAVLAGWRSAMVALIAGQTLAWYWIVDSASYELQKTGYIAALAAATFSQLIAVVVIWQYQKEIDRAWSRREDQLDLVHQALAEIDHRTTNNYQTVLSLVQAQAKRADAPVKQALTQVADRIEAIAMASRQMTIGSDNLEQVHLSEHLGELCTQIKRGLARPGVNLECHSDELSLDAEQAVALSIIINELVTNALKHAFPNDRQGSITVSLRKRGRQLQLSVADNGIGMKKSVRSRGKGLGSRLIDMFAKQLKAEHQFSSDEGGTRHLILVPLSA
jgi:two-component sensor histidine kinase